MNTWKRVRLAVLFLVAAAAVLSAGAPAVAGKVRPNPPPIWGWTELTPTDPQSGASGEATVYAYDDGYGGTMGSMTVTCQKLTRGATYHVRVFDYWGASTTFPLTAKSGLRWQGSGWIPSLWGGPCVVDVVNDTGDVVLTGEFWARFNLSGNRVTLQPRP